MKTKFYWVALLASAALIAQAKAGGHHGGGGGGFAGGASMRSSPGPSFHSMPARSFGAGRPMYSGQRFSSVGVRQFVPGNINRGDHPARFANAGNRAITNARRGGNGAGQVRKGASLPQNWRSHVVAQHSANWHRDWDRSRDHTWHGHHCRFVNGSWFIFDFGYPWYPYDYPYDYYASDYYPGQYYPSTYDSSEQDADSTVAIAQEQLSRLGYYRGEIDGSFGAATRRAVMLYQRDHGLRVTGYLTMDTVRALGLPRVAGN